MLDVTRSREESGHVVAGRGIIGATGNASLVRLDRHISKAIRRLLVAAGPLQRTELGLQLDERPLSQRVIAGCEVLQLATVLGVRRVVVASEIVNVAQSRMGTDDQ